MLSNDDIRLILSSVKGVWTEVSEKDIVFSILYNSLEDKDVAYKYAYRAKGNGEARYKDTKFKALLTALEPFGIGGISEDTITKEENKVALIKYLYTIDEWLKDKRLDPKDAMKMQCDIRFKLHDKFKMEESQNKGRIFNLPPKHDCVCPHTQCECDYWPSKEACIKHYKLKE